MASQPHPQREQHDSPPLPAGPRHKRGRAGTDRRPLPAVDENLIEPETRFELLDGRLRETMPAKPPHAMANCRLAYVLQASVRPGFRAAVDMLTRVDRISEFAPDASVFPEETDPATGGRRLEHLAFEVLDTQRRARVSRKARLLSDRGVRRIFAIEVGPGRVLEWSRARGRWVALAADGQLDDPECLVEALPVRALLDAAAADDATARALLARENPVLLEHASEQRRRGHAAGLLEGKAAGLLEGKAAGLLEGKAAGLLEGKAAGLRLVIEDLCEVLALPIDAARRQHLASLGAEGLAALRAHIKHHGSWP
jgi:Uma2 family endonuclease